MFLPLCRSDDTPVGHQQRSDRFDESSRRKRIQSEQITINHPVAKRVGIGKIEPIKTTTNQRERPIEGIIMADAKPEATEIERQGI